MNSKTTAIPPGTTQTAAHSPDSAIGFQFTLTVRGFEHFEVGFPPANLAGAGILDALVRSQLSIAGIKISDGSVSGPLNDCAGMYIVDDWVRGVAALRSVFKFPLASCFKVDLFRYDPAELIWRCVDTDKPVRFIAAEDPEFSKRNSQAIQSAIATLEKLRNLSDAADTLPPSDPIQQ